MRLFLKTKFRLIATLLILSVAILSILWILSTAMTTKTGNINITKIQVSDKLYSYTLFGDFYFRIMNFDEKGDKVFQLSELIPVRAYLGYESKDTLQVPFIRGSNEGKPMVLSEHGGSSNETTELIESLKKFSKAYIKIVATQDKDLFLAAKKRAQDMNRNLFNKNVELLPFKDDDYYEKAIELPIDNILFKPPKLVNLESKIKSKEVCPKGEWCPDIVKWTFNESDAVYLQYMEQFHNNNLDDYIESKIEKKMFKDNIVVKTVKPYNGAVQKIFFELSLKNNKIKSYYMDENGYVYILTFSANNRKSLVNNLQSYLKLSYGLNFINVKGFENSFAMKQNELINIGKKISDSWIDTLYVISKYEDTALEPILSKSVNAKLGKHDKLTEVTKPNKEVIKIHALIDFFNNDYFQRIKDLNKQELEKYKDSVRFTFNEMIKYKDLVSDYPNEEMLQKFKKLNDYAVRFDNAVSEAEEQIDSWAFWGVKYKKISDRCYNLECIEDINRKKGWK